MIDEPAPEGEPAENGADRPGGGRRAWLTAGVGSVGATSFFSDAGHEITTSMLPGFLTATLHASAGALGLIEGISDALTGVMALIGGPLANDRRRRGRLAGGGYLGTAAATGAIGLAATVWQAGALRAVAWLSRGLRSPARDSLLASLTPPGAYGRAFGLERAGDNLGAVVGPLLAAGLVAWIGIRPTMWCAAVPGLLAAVMITVAARQAHKLPATEKRHVGFELRRLHAAGLLRPLIPVLCFELGNVATTLLILRSTQLLTHGGRSAAAATSLTILVYAAHNAFGALVAFAGGHWIDRTGPRVVLFTGATCYIVAYAGFAYGGHAWLPLLIAFSLAGSGIGLAETAQSTLVARVLPDGLRGSGFGILAGIRLIGDFCSSAVVGLLYAAVSPAVGFGYAAAWMLLAAVASLVSSLVPPHGRGT